MKKFDEPLFVSLELNTECGLNCIFCQGRKQKFNIRKEILEKIIFFIKKSKILNAVILSGGEPFISPYLEKILNVCKRKNIAVSIDTNLNFYTDKEIKIYNYLNNISQIRFKVLSVQEEKHDFYVGKRGHFKKTLSFLKKMNKIFKKPKVAIFPILNFNFCEINNLLNFAKNISYMLISSLILITKVLHMHLLFINIGSQRL